MKHKHRSYIHKLTELLSRHKLLLFIAYITVCGGVLRFYNLNWDEGNFFHPDERNIANAVSKIHFFSQLNPEFFAYGGFTIYLTRAIGDLITLITHDTNWTSDWGKINVIARGISAFFSTSTVPLIFLLTRKLVNTKVAITAAILTAFTVSLIQMAHYGVTESFITFLAVLLCYLSLLILEKPSIGRYLIGGTIWGIALASKTSALSFIIFPALAHLILYKKDVKHIINHTLKMVVFLLVSVGLFLLFSPYTIITFEKFYDSMQYESGVVSGKLLVVYVYQFIGTPSYLFQYINLFWQLGPVHILSIPACIYIFILAKQKKNKRIAVFLSFPVLYFLYVGNWHTKFIRYMVPIIPFLIIIISVFVSYLLKQIPQQWKKAIHIIIILPSILWSLAFFTVYTRPQTRIAASEWVYKHVPPGNKLLTEHWDDGLPVTRPTGSPSQYIIESLEIYNPDNVQKIDYYGEKLSSADYIVINSRRLYGTLIHQPDRYPITSKYYTLLFSERLGYKKVGEFTSYPELFGWQINDDLSEETFQVYEHPKVLIYKNIHRYDKQQIITILNN